MSQSFHGKTGANVRWSRTPWVTRVWARVDQRGPDECWPWKGASNSFGYGVIYIKPDGQRKRPFQAGHIIWSLTTGRDWPVGLEQRHSCDNPPCVNPAHITPGTRRENVHDALDRGRHANHAGRTTGRFSTGE